MGAISIRELNANVSKVLSRVERGETLDITKNGRVIAEIGPKDRSDPEWQKAYEATKAFLAQGLPLNVGKVTEDDKYGDARL